MSCMESLNIILKNSSLYPLVHSKLFFHLLDYEIGSFLSFPPHFIVSLFDTNSTLEQFIFWINSALFLQKRSRSVLVSRTPWSGASCVQHRFSGFLSYIFNVLSAYLLLSHSKLKRPSILYPRFFHTFPLISEDVTIVNQRAMPLQVTCVVTALPVTKCGLYAKRF